MDKEIEKDKNRKNDYYLEKRAVTKCVLHKIGVVEIKRNYYRHKESGKYAYLLDYYLGLEKYKRVSTIIQSEVIEKAVNSSYSEAGKNITLTGESLSKQAVGNLLKKLRLEHSPERKTKKKIVKTLFIEADEDHVSLQKVRIVNGRRVNTAEPKLALIYENIEKTGKRVKKTGKHYISGLYKNSEKFWEEVLNYIEATYDYEKLEQIYLCGDGARWIKSGVEVLGKCTFVLDKFHRNKYIHDCLSHLNENEISGIKTELYKSILDMNKNYFF